jgi:hypothetical protein
VGGIQGLDTNLANTWPANETVIWVGELQLRPPTHLGVDSGMDPGKTAAQVVQLF